MSEVLQSEVTLDEALRDGVRTYRNGCNFRLLRKADGSYWLEYGCYCLVNLATGPERLLINWLGGPKATQPKRLDGVSRTTLLELLKRRPCECCGGTLFEYAAAPAESPPEKPPTLKADS